MSAHMDAARAEADRRYGRPDYGMGPFLHRAFMDGADWAAGRAETTTHEHVWKRQQNVTSKGYRMQSIEVCQTEGCDAARPAETTTATAEGASLVVSHDAASEAIEASTFLSREAKDEVQSILDTLATARTHPTRDQIEEAIESGKEAFADALAADVATGPQNDYIADAVLALLNQGDQP